MMKSGGGAFRREVMTVIALLLFGMLAACARGAETPHPTTDLRPTATVDPCVFELSGEDIIARQEAEKDALTVFFGGEIPQDWRDFAKQHNLSFEEGEQGWQLDLSSDMEIQISSSTAFVRVPFCMIPEADVQEQCDFELSVLPWRSYILSGADGSLGIQFPPGPMPKDWTALAEKYNLIITREEEIGRELLMPMGSQLTEDADQAYVHIPDCGARVGTVPAEYETGEAAGREEAVCGVKLSRYPDGTLVKMGGFQNSIISFPPQSEIAPDWVMFFSFYNFSSTVSDSGYTVYALAEGVQVECFEAYCLLGSDPCSMLLVAGVRGPQITDGVFNTGALPIGANIVTEHGGRIWIDLPYGPTLVKWRELAELEQQLRVDDLPDGWGRAYFPLHSLIEYRDDETVDIVLASGRPPALADMAGWVVVNPCQLLLGPMPSGAQMTKTPWGPLDFDLPTGVVADIWEIEANKDERITLSGEGVGTDRRVVFSFPDFTTIEENEDGSVLVTFFECELPEPPEEVVP